MGETGAYDVERFAPERGSALGARVRVAGAPVDALDGWRLLREDAALRRALAEDLRAAPFASCYWETPPVRRDQRGRPFEWVVLDAPALARATPEPEVFAEPLSSGADVEAFPNLGGDARLVVPAARAPDAAYPHLLAFVRAAPAEQVDALFERVGREVVDWIERSADPLWVSTSGAGVAWLHVRLDARPKYITYRPYLDVPSGTTEAAATPNEP